MRRKEETGRIEAEPRRRFPLRPGVFTHRSLWRRGATLADRSTSSFVATFYGSWRRTSGCIVDCPSEGSCPKGRATRADHVEGRRVTFQDGMLYGVTASGRDGSILLGGGVAPLGDRPAVAFDMAYQRVTGELARADRRPRRRHRRSATLWATCRGLARISTARGRRR